MCRRSTRTFDRLFAFGIDPPPGELPSDQPTDWPGLAEVEHYQQRTRETIDQLLADVPEQLLHVAIEHRLMHAETFAYILHQLDYGNKVAPHQGRPGWRPAGSRGTAATELIPIPAGPADLGWTPAAPSAGTTNSRRTRWRSPRSPWRSTR